MNIQNLFIHSVTGLLSLLFAASISRTGTLMPSHRAKAQILQETAAARKMSVGAQFRRSLGVLMEKMYSASPHFIRCIKPNNDKLPGVFHPEEVLRQLRYNGLMETMRIRRDGFSWRPSFQEFVERYRILLLTPQVPVTKESCVSILQRTPLRDWQCGSSRLFFKYWHQDELNQQLLKLHEAAAKIQKYYKGLRCRRVYQKLLEEMKIQEKLKMEEQERERTRLQDLEAQKSAIRPIPIPRKRPPPIRIKSGDVPSELPVPRPRSQLIQLSPFDNAIRRIPSVKSEEGEMRRIQRRKTLLWFQETQAKKVLDDGAFPPWLYGMISRRDTENLLMDKEIGDFLIRISQTRAGYILSYRGRDSCRHYMIDVRCNGCYVILGEDRAHSSLSSLLEYYQTIGIQPYGETLRRACDKMGGWEPDCEELKFLTRTLSLGDENVPAPRAGSASNQSEHRKLEEPAHPLPRFHKSIRRAMHEIQQASSAQKPPEPEWSHVSEIL